MGFFGSSPEEQKIQDFLLNPKKSIYDLLKEIKDLKEIKEEDKIFYTERIAEINETRNKQVQRAEDTLDAGRQDWEMEKEALIEEHGRAIIMKDAEIINLHAQADMDLIKHKEAIKQIEREWETKNQQFVAKKEADFCHEVHELKEEQMEAQAELAEKVTKAAIQECFKGTEELLKPYLKKVFDEKGKDGSCFIRE